MFRRGGVAGGPTEIERGCPRALAPNSTMASQTESGFAYWTERRNLQSRRHASAPRRP